LLNVAPELLCAADRDGRLPLHAVVDQESMLTYPEKTEELVSVVQLLIERHPEALQQPDANGNLPLHAAARRYALVPILRMLTVLIISPTRSEFGTTEGCCRSTWRCTGCGPWPLRR
jgi:hypothetical protein